MKERIEVFENDSGILEAIAKQYQPGSKEHMALEHAAIALWYVLTEDYQGFTAYVQRCKGDLTPEQRAYLAQLGIDPDSEPG